MQKMKWSKYNYYHEIEDKTLIFNTYTKKGIVTNSKDIEKYSKKQIDKLVEKGMLIDSKVDEKKIVDLDFFKWTYSDKILHLTIIPTDACNFMCVYCYENHEEHFMNREVADSIINFVRKNVRQFKVLSIGWFGGEPLLAVETVKYIMKELKKICKENKVLLTSNMTTNGYLLNKEIFKQLLECEVRFFQITIDGNEKIHNNQRPHKNKTGTYDQIMNNLKDINDVWSDQRFEIGIRINISKEIDENRENILQQFAKMFKNYTKVTFIFEWIRDWGGNIRSDIVTTAAICKNWIQCCTQSGLKCADMLTNNCGLEFCEACKYNGYLVDYDGTLKKCSIALYDNIYADVNVVGKLDKYGRMKLDKQHMADWLIKQNDKKECYECNVYPICMGVNCPLSTNIRGEKKCLPVIELLPLYLENLYMLGKFENILENE